MNEANTAKNDFKEGELVVLNSGGPLMTVCSVEYDYLRCAWFMLTESEAKKDGSVVRDTFHYSSVCRFN
jgi:uncharacterized protein YodC (DUF2158 family)